MVCWSANFLCNARKVSNKDESSVSLIANFFYLLLFSFCCMFVATIVNHYQVCLFFPIYHIASTLCYL